MSESSKTIAFVAIGAVALTAAYFIDSPTQAVSTAGKVATMLNTDFEVDAPKRLRIVKFDRPTAETRQFEVASLDGVWSIPSKENYPADATQQMAAAANALIDRKVLRVAGESAQSHDEFGVVDPLASSLDSNSTGVGTRVTMSDADDKPLVDMIIGKAVRGAEGQRYVREANKDIVYIIELNQDSLSTSFDDWIEDDLLKISPFDITKVFINDYSADLGFGMTADGQIAPRINWDRRGEITLGYNNDDAKWKLLDLKKYDRQKREMVEDKLADDEELNQEALGELRNGLDDLLIVDVSKKPAGLSDDLKAGEDFLKNRDAIDDLVQKGFVPAPVEPGAPPEILSSEGEIICTMRDGVEYVLRFGQLKVQTDAADAEAEPADPVAGEAAKAGADPVADAAAAAKEAGSDDAKNLHRYLFVMARFNQDAIPKADVKPLPEAPSTPPAEEAAAGDANEGEPASAGGESPSEAPSPDEAAGDAAPTQTPPAEEPAAAAPPAGGDEAAAADQAEPTDEATPADAGAPDTENAATEGAEAEATASEDPAADESATAAAEPADEAADSPAAEAPKDPAAERLAAERGEVEQDNQREQDRYKEAVESGKKRVAELNDRFGDWYYVISNDVYKQIHLGRDDVIKKKGAPAAAEGDAANPLSGLPNLPGGTPGAPEAEASAPE